MLFDLNNLATAVTVAESEDIMKKDTLRVTKARFSTMGIKIFQKDIKSVETIKSENIGHATGWTKDTIKVEMKNGKTYIYTATPTGIYSGLFEFTLV